MRVGVVNWRTTTEDVDRNSVEPGTVTITCAFDNVLTQQHGRFQDGVVASLVDVFLRR